MKKRILCTLIFSLLVLTACSSETPKATPDEITPSAIVETKVEETVRETVAQTEKSTESAEAETVVVTTKIEQQAEVEIVERAEETKAPAQAQKITQESSPKPTTKPTQKPKQESVKQEPNSSNNEQDIHNIVSYIISHNQSKGMMYDTTLNTSNSGWLFAYQGCLNTTANRTYEEQLSRTVSGLDADIDSILALDGYATSYSQMGFNCYAEKQSDDTYNIYFCYG
ncbi:MAG: hypothetical protein E7513_05375 [Ruminococcaceae bacterium]|nr:hypothetical protein [Oscillospiraceae bacterium]